MAQRTSSARNAQMAVVTAVPDWRSPIDGNRKGEILTCATQVIDDVWPILRDAYKRELLESCVRRRDKASGNFVASFVCVMRAPVRASFDTGSTKLGTLQAGEVINVTEVREREDGRVRVRFPGGWVSAVAPDGTVRLRKQESTPGSAKSVLVPTTATAESSPVGLPGQTGHPSAPAPPVVADHTNGFPDLMTATPPISAAGVDLLSVPAPEPSPASPDPFGFAAAPAPQAPDPFGFVVLGSPAPAPASPAAATADLLGLGGAMAAAPGDSLPSGWVKKESEKYAGKFFYFHAATNKTQWEKPVDPGAPTSAPPMPSSKGAKSKKGKMGGLMGKAKAKAAAAAEQASKAMAAPEVPIPQQEATLPPGWVKKESSQYAGKFFYFHAATNTTQWDRPAAETASASPAPQVDLLGMFPTPAPAPAIAAPAATAAPNLLLGLPPAFTAARPTSQQPAAVPAAVLADQVSPPTAAAVKAGRKVSGAVQKEAGVRKIWQPWVLMLQGSTLSWCKYETDTVGRGSIALSSNWQAGPLDEGSSLSDSGFVLRHSNNQHKCFYFDAETADARQNWLDAIQAAIELSAGQQAGQQPAVAASPKAATASKAGRFMKGMRDRVAEAADVSGLLLGAGGTEDDIVDDDTDLLIAIGCRARSGVLTMEAVGGRNRHEERFFTLTSNAELMFFKSEDDAATGRVPLGRIPLAQRWRVAATWRAEFPHAIKVWDCSSMATRMDKDHVYYLHAKDQGEQMAWVEDIEDAILSLRFGEMQPYQLLLQRAMARAYKLQKDAQSLPYKPMLLAELGLAELCCTRAQEGLSGFIEQYMQAQPPDCDKERIIEALNQDILEVVTVACDKAWDLWEQELSQLYAQAEQFLTHPATMDALLTAEANAQRLLDTQPGDSITHLATELCKQDIVPGLRRALSAQIKPLRTLLEELTPLAIGISVMLQRLVRHGSPPSNQALSGLLEASTQTVQNWVRGLERKRTANPSSSTRAAAVSALFEGDLMASIGESILSVLESLTPELLDSTMVKAADALDGLEDRVRFAKMDGAVANRSAAELCVDMEEDAGRKFVAGLRRLVGYIRLQQQQAVSSSRVEVTVGLSWGCNQALLECLLAATETFFLAMTDQLDDTENGSAADLEAAQQQNHRPLARGLMYAALTRVGSVGKSALAAARAAMTGFQQKAQVELNDWFDGLIVDMATAYAARELDVQIRGAIEQLPEDHLFSGDGSSCSAEDQKQLAEFCRAEWIATRRLREVIVEELQGVLREFRGDLSSLWAKAADDYSFRMDSTCAM